MTHIYRSKAEKIRWLFQTHSGPRDRAGITDMIKDISVECDCLPEYVRVVLFQRHAKPHGMSKADVTYWEKRCGVSGAKAARDAMTAWRKERMRRGKRVLAIP